MPVNLLIAMWAAIAFTIYWIDVFRGPVKIPALNFKPINCEACLPVWLTLAFYAASLYFCNIVSLIAGAFTAAILTTLILKHIRK